MCWTTLIRLTRLIAIAAIVALWSLAALAQAQLERASQSIDIAESTGFQQQIQLDKWNPITITVRNTGAALTGYLEIIAADSSDRIDDQTRYRQPLELAKGAQKRLQFTIFISRITEPLRIQVVTAAGEITSKSVELRSKLSQQRFIVALARDVNLDYLNDRKSHRVRVVNPLPDFLPNHWQGYDGVEAVILHRYALSTLTPRQYSALTKWISSGGTLLVSGGYDTAILRTPRIAQLLPARVTGTQQLDTQTTLPTALGPAPGDAVQPLILEGPLGIASVDDTGINTVHHINNVPLVLEHRHGDGRVVLLTFDLTDNSFQRWPGMRQFMYRMLRLSPVTSITINNQQNRDHAQASLLSQLIRQRAIDYPGHATVIAFASFYLIVLALYTLQSDDTSHSRRWKTLLAYTLPIVFSAAAIGLFHRLLFPQLPSLASVAVIEPIENSALARLQLELGLHSTRTHPLRIRYTGATPVLRATTAPSLSNLPIKADREMSLAPWIFEQGNATGAQPLDAIPYTMFSARGVDIIEFAVNGSYQPNALLEFHNTSGRSITDLRAITADDVFELGAVEDGQTVNAELRTGMPSGRDNWRGKLRAAHAGSNTPVAAIEAILKGRYGAHFSQHSDTSVLLVGFTSNPWTMNNSKWNRIDLTMIVWRIHQQAIQP